MPGPVPEIRPSPAIAEIAKRTYQGRNAVKSGGLDIMTETIHVLNFSGSTSLTLPGAGELGLTRSSFAVEAWIYLSNIIGSNILLGSESEETLDGLNIGFRDGRPLLRIGELETLGNTTLSSETWYHLAFCHNKETDTQSIYVNGTLDAFAEEREDLTGTDPIYLGRTFSAAPSLFRTHALFRE